MHAPALFSLSQPCPKTRPRDLKVDPKLKQKKELQIHTDSLSCFWSPKKLNWFPKLPQRHQKQIQNGSKVRSRTDSAKRFSQDLHKGPCWSVLGCASVFSLLDFDFFCNLFCSLLELSCRAKFRNALNKTSSGE